MTDSTKEGSDRPARRGEAAWKAAKDDIAARNEQARKAGRKLRQADELHAAQERAAAHRREMATLIGKSGAR